MVSILGKDLRWEYQDFYIKPVSNQTTPVAAQPIRATYLYDMAARRSGSSRKGKGKTSSAKSAASTSNASTSANDTSDFSPEQLALYKVMQAQKKAATAAEDEGTQIPILPCLGS